MLARFRGGGVFNQCVDLKEVQVAPQPHHSRNKQAHSLAAFVRGFISINKKDRSGGLLICNHIANHQTYAGTLNVVNHQQLRLFISANGTISNVETFGIPFFPMSILILIHYQCHQLLFSKKMSKTYHLKKLH